MRVYGTVFVRSMLEGLFYHFVAALFVIYNDFLAMVLCVVFLIERILVCDGGDVRFDVYIIMLFNRRFTERVLVRVE